MAIRVPPQNCPLAGSDPDATIRAVTNAPTGFAGPVGIGCDVIADHDVPAIANAIFAACGERRRELPLGRRQSRA